MELPALKVGKPRPTPVVRGGITYCRGDRKGTWLDKNAMLMASKALGHNRISIIASNYLRL